MQIFNFFGSILGYLLWFLFQIFRNYGVAIIFFTIILKIVMFPAAIKQQRSMAAQAKLGEKQKELQKKYANNRNKYNEELQKLYEKEGVSPSSGCLTTLIPLPIMFGIYYAVVMPLSNSLHIASENIAKAIAYINTVPGMVSTGNTLQQELVILRNWSTLRANLAPMFSEADVANIDSFAGGFNFLGLDLLGTPATAAFSEMLWLIPVLSLLSYVGMQVYQLWYQKKQGASNQGCMIVMMIVFPLMSAYWAYTMPAAVGFYWVISALTSWVQSVITNKYFSVGQMTAMQEAQRAVTLELAENDIRPLPATAQKKIADRIAAGNQPKQLPEQQGKQSSKKKK